MLKKIIIMKIRKHGLEGLVWISMCVFFLVFFFFFLSDEQGGWKFFHEDGGRL